MRCSLWRPPVQAGPEKKRGSPAGRAGGDGAASDVTGLSLAHGDWVVLVSDGVTGGDEDRWLRDQLSAFDGDSPQALAQAILEQSVERVGAGDDRTILALRLLEQKQA